MFKTGFQFSYGVVNSGRNTIQAGRLYIMTYKVFTALCWQKAEKNIQAEEPIPLDLVYVETRKRKPGRNYKVTYAL